MPDAVYAAGEQNVVRASVHGSAGGRELSGRYRVTLDGGQLAFVSGEGEVPTSLYLPVRMLAGAQLSAGALVLRLESGESLTISDGDNLAALSGYLETAVCSVGEVMRSSRVAGSRRAAPGEDHDRFFAPFLAARLRLQEASDVRRKLEAVSAGELRAGVLRALDAFASERFRNEPADRRALGAELEEYAAPLFSALDELDAASAGAREAAPERAFTAWRSWRDAVANAFTQAERAWLRAMPVLEEFPRSEPDARGPARRWRAGK
ncbi:MAG TPA: hypothetical protein VKZ41_05955 [Gemmatimonadales bacterium]|nr:hypothetical protein [Gemmatimonadales bacterium]